MIIYQLQMIEQPVANQTDQKPFDSTSALEKAIRLDKKHTNFEYFDSLRSISLRIAYPQTVAEGPSSETLLKSLWKHVGNYYFKKVQQGEFERLNYLSLVLNSQNQGKHRFVASEEFWSLLSQIFSDRYLQRFILSTKEKADYQNWIEYLYITYLVTNSNDTKQHKKLVATFQSIKKNLKQIFDSKRSMTSKFQLQSEQLGKMVNQDVDFDDDEVTDEINRLEEEILEIQEEVQPIFDKLKQRVQTQISLQDVIFCENQSNSHQMIEEKRLQNISVIERRLEKLQNFATQTKYIEYLIHQLEKKQIAQSISKLYRLQKVKGEVKIQLFFEESMGIKPITVSEKQFEQINSLREYSLLKFYNTASKSKYSFVCQNYLGFRDIYENRNKPCKLKNKDIIEQMKKTNADPLHLPYYKEFSKMEICHHCKLLHPESSLVKCQYRSVRCGNPIPPSPYYDSYIFQILKNQQSRVSAIRFLNSSQARRNSYFYYQKDSDEFICDRKYCRYCLKNYEDSKQKSSGLCPYCRGLCYCTRCARNDMMIRLKSMYILMGGDINKLQRESYFEKYFLINDEQMGLRKKDKSGKTSRRSQSAPNRMNDKMINIRYQLEDLRIICGLVKRRQKNKQKLFGCQKQIFRKKIEQFCPDFYFERLQKSKDSQQGQSKSLQANMNDKLTKKLKRMI